MSRQALIGRFSNAGVVLSHDLAHRHGCKASGSTFAWAEGPRKPLVPPGWMDGGMSFRPRACNHSMSAMSKEPACHTMFLWGEVMEHYHADHAGVIGAKGFAMAKDRRF